MHRMVHAALMVVLAATLSGCASHRYVIIDPPNTPLENYTVLEVKDFESHLQEDDAVKVAGELPEMIVRELQEYNSKHPKSTLFSQVTRFSEDSAQVLVLEGVLLSYEKGSQAKRHFIGMGPGKAYCTVQCTFIDKTTGQQVLKANFESALSGRFFGGGAKESAKGVVKAMTDYLKKTY